MKYHIGDKLKVKKGCEDVCETYLSYKGTSIQITDIRDSKYTYRVFYGGGAVGSCNCFTDEYLEPFEKTLENLEVGDLVVDEKGNFRKVLGSCGNICFLSHFNQDHTSIDLDVFNSGFTLIQMKNYSWKPYTPPTTEIHELTIADVAKLKGVDPSQIKIID